MFFLKECIVCDNLITRMGTKRFIRKWWNMGENILKLNGLSIEILERLSYESDLGISLKKNLHYFDKARLISVC